jgi:hypothetical protein
VYLKILDVTAMNLVELIVTRTMEILNSLDFKDFARKKPTFFTRNRKMPFQELMVFMLFHLKCSIPSALRRFFKERGTDTTMAQQSLCEAREKVNVSAFKHLFTEAVKTTVEHRKETWNGYRIYATDGSKIALPDDKKLLAHYGGTGKNADSPTAQGSALYDVLNDTLIDVAMEPLNTGERTLAEGHISALLTLPVTDKNLLIYDRGYPSFDFIKKHEDEGLFYLMRVKTKFNAAIDAQTKADGYVWLGKDGERIHVRVIKFFLNSGEMEMLITNVTDRRLGKKAFKKLYFRRWPVEVKYGVIKDKLQVENFSSLSVDGVKQEFFAAMFMSNLVSATAFDVQSEVEEARVDKDNKFEYKVNLNELIGILKDNLVSAVFEPCPIRQASIMDRILRDAKRYVTPIRPDRSVPRNSNPRTVRFHHNRKTNC